MKLLIEKGRVIDPASGRDERADVAIAAGRIVAIGSAPPDFTPERRVDAAGCIVMPGLVDLAVRLREPGHEHEGMLQSELKAAAAGGVTSLVCLPDTDPPLDEPGLVEMLKFRARQLSSCRLFPLGALTRGLHGDALTEMAHLSEAGCVGFSQADQPVRDTNLLMRALQYAATFGHTAWLRPQDAWLSTGVAANGAVA
ncbi:MAG TPA: dihydroorotase, partial [Burkholderiaceae bacterium]